MRLYFIYTVLIEFLLTKEVIDMKKQIIALSVVVMLILSSCSMFNAPPGTVHSKLTPIGAVIEEDRKSVV